MSHREREDIDGDDAPDTWYAERDRMYIIISIRAGAVAAVAERPLINMVSLWQQRFCNRRAAAVVVSLPR